MDEQSNEEAKGGRKILGGKLSMKRRRLYGSLLHFRLHERLASPLSADSSKGREKFRGKRHGKKREQVSGENIAENKYCLEIVKQSSKYNSIRKSPF